MEEVSSYKLQVRNRMMQMHFTKLAVWHKSIILTKEIYRLANLLPRSEQYELCSQLKRAASSIPANIAEGSQRTSAKEFAHFLLIAKGSLAEVQSHLLLVLELRFLQKEETSVSLGLIREIDRMLHAFHAKLAA